MTGITNYDELVATANRWLKNSTTRVEVPALIALAEETLRMRLRVTGSETISDATTSGIGVGLPADFGGLIDLGIPGSLDAPLEQVPIAYLRGLDRSCTGTARMYAIADETIHFWPSTPATLEMVYYRTIQPLSATAPNDTNWLLKLSSSLYLYSTLCEAAGFGMEDERLPLWERKREELIGHVNRDSEAKRWSRGPLICRRVN